MTPAPARLLSAEIVDLLASSGHERVGAADFASLCRQARAMAELTGHRFVVSPGYSSVLGNVWYVACGPGTPSLVEAIESAVAAEAARKET
jgi:hypothetical protein